MEEYMHLINRNLSYRERRQVLDVVSESLVNKDKVILNIGKFFYKLITKLKVMPMMGKYMECKGDITKLDGYKNLAESIKLLKSDAYVDISTHAVTVEAALLNLQIRKKLFTLACGSDEAKFSKLLFATAVKMIIGTTSALIANSSTVNGGDEKHKPYSSFAISCLNSFNEECKKGTVDKLMRAELGLEGEQVKETVAFSLMDAAELAVQEAGAFSTYNKLMIAAPFVGALLAKSSVIISTLRKAVYWVYYTRIDLADYLEQQAAYLELNKVVLENRKDLSDDKRMKLLENQEKWRQRLLKLSDKIQLDDIKAERKAKESATKDEKELNAKDLIGPDPDLPDGAPNFF